MAKKGAKYKWDKRGLVVVVGDPWIVSCVTWYVVVSR
jgi:hypothetical protein